MTESTPTPLSHLQILLTDEEDTEFVILLHERIKSFNNETSPYHLEARTPGYIKPLIIKAFDEAGELVGGLAATTFWDWLYIDDFWLSRSWRRQRLGSKLILMAEEEAVRRTCKWVQLQTFSFQARCFYEQLGYRVVGTMEDYPPGEAMYWMRKDLP